MVVLAVSPKVRRHAPTNRSARAHEVRDAEGTDQRRFCCYVLIIQTVHAEKCVWSPELKNSPVESAGVAGETYRMGEELLCTLYNASEAVERQ